MKVYVENKKISLKFMIGTKTVLLIMSGELEIENEIFKDGTFGS